MTSLILSKEQTKYAVAKRAYEAILKIEIEELKKIEHLMDENEEEYIKQEIAIHRRLQTRDFYTELRQAEDEMIAWANDKVSKSKHFTAAHKATIAEAMEKSTNLQLRKKLVDLAFRLA